MTEPGPISNRPPTERAELAAPATTERAELAAPATTDRAGLAAPATTDRTGHASIATTIRVRWSDVDPAGIAFYPRFFEWYDLGCEELFASLGLPWPEAFPKYEIVGVPIMESGSKFASPARYGDVLTIRSAVVWVKDRTFRMEHTISVGDRLCASGFEIRAWVARPATPGGRLAAKPIPDEVVRKLTGGSAR